MYARLSDNEILDGFRQGKAGVIRNYFYEYCHTAYYIYDQKYGLSQKENLDFMSMAHQYALYLMEHDWKPLESRSQNVSLRTWMISGFRYVVLDALKWYKREYGSITFEDYLRSFDVTDDLRLEFNKAIKDLCDKHLNQQDRLIVEMMLISGFKTKDIAAQMGITPSAVSQKYNKIKDKVIIPYFRENFDMDFDAPELMDMEEAMAEDMAVGQAPAPPVHRRSIFDSLRRKAERCRMCMDESTAEDMEQKRTTDGAASAITSSLADCRVASDVDRRSTPERITELAPNEIFVFGSNLKGMHGGGAAWTAYQKFGAIMGQGVGLQGQSYGIPTMQGGVETIRPYVDEFIAFAKEHPELTFLVTRIGCGIAGFTNEEISPLFAEAHQVDNIILPSGW